jgi:hypothetical protein
MEKFEWENFISCTTCKKDDEDEFQSFEDKIEPKKNICNLINMDSNAYFCIHCNKKHMRNVNKKSFI